MKIEPIEMEKFRAFVDQIPYPRDATIIKAFYLTASRASELTTKSSPWDLLHEQSKPYGIFLNYSIQDYEIPSAKIGEPAKIEKVLTLRQAVAKRTKHKRKTEDQSREMSPEEIADHLPAEANMIDPTDPRRKRRTSFRTMYLEKPSSVDPLLVKAFLGRIFFKVIALPTSPEYEPWTKDLLQYISKTGSLTFNITRQRLWQIVKQHLSKLDSHVHPHTLRHWRISHLLENYNFDPTQITLYAGWTFRSTFGMMGINASANLDTYLHLQWKNYFPKLLRRL